MFIHIVLIIIFLIVVPILFGSTIVSFLNYDKGIINSYVVGFFSMMALCELISVPSILCKISFSTVLVLFLIIVSIVILIGLIQKRSIAALNIAELKQRITKYEAVEYISLIVMLIVFGVIIVNSIRLYVIDEDDSRFIVTAADMVRTNTLFLSDPNTGVVHNAWSYGIDVSKDIIAPHAVFCAMLSRLTNSNVTMFMHSTYSVFVYLLALFVYDNLASELINGIDSLKGNKHKAAYKYLFLTLLFVVTIFHYSTRSTRETVFLVRLWQGKAILASVIIPALFWILYRLYRCEERASYYLLFIISLAGCLTSSMATLILPIVIGLYGIIYGIAKKSVKLTVSVYASAIIPVILALISLYIRNELILC